MKRLLQIFTSGVMGGIAWIVGMIVFFGPAQSILANPKLQSAKFIAVMEHIEPLPRMRGNIWIIIVGLLSIGLIYSLVFSFVGQKLSGNSFQKGMKFGLISWGLMVPWFEFYLPWNVMHEPTLLVFLEAFCWVLVLMLVGISIALTSDVFNSRFGY
ncbi:MAG: hypothetical protein AAF348_10010 [Bacteroidota bacterium]